MSLENNTKHREILKRIFKELTQEQFELFEITCDRFQLDPLSKQIYPVVRYDKKKNEHVMCIQTSIDGFRSIAERTEKYSPGKDTQFSYDEKGKLVAAKVYVKKLTQDGTWHDISATAFLKEYASTGTFWERFTHVMLEKCAEARALRRAFPQLSGLYTYDEMPENSDEDKKPKIEKKAVEDTQKIFKIDKKISEEQIEKMEKAIGAYPEIKNGLLAICNVKNLKDITESQLKACQEYAVEHIKKIKEEKKEEIKNENN